MSTTDEIQMGEWRGHVLPIDAVRERMIVEQSTRDYWKQEHDSNGEWHKKLPGYCYICVEEKTWS